MGSSGSRPFWLAKLEENMPELVRKLELRVLMHMTAVSCGRKAASMQGMDSRDRLECYRHFTAASVKACSKETLPSFKKNMYRRAFRTGRCLSLLPGLKEWENKKRLIVLLYRNIGIELRIVEEEDRIEDRAKKDLGEEDKGKQDRVEENRGEKDRRKEGRVEKNRGKDDRGEKERRQTVCRLNIPHCSFSSAYSPETCRVMSAMDAGIISGILGGGRLEFFQRKTEGCPCCRAFYQK